MRPCLEATEMCDGLLVSVWTKCEQKLNKEHLVYLLVYSVFSVCVCVCVFRFQVD